MPLNEPPGNFIRTPLLVEMLFLFINCLILVCREGKGRTGRRLRHTRQGGIQKVKFQKLKCC